VGVDGGFEAADADLEVWDFALEGVEQLVSRHRRAGHSGLPETIDDLCQESTSHVALTAQRPE
jgi:hypothetical protein